GDGFAFEPTCGVHIGSGRGTGYVAERDRRSNIRGVQNFWALWNDPEKWDRKEFKHVFYGHHLASNRASRIVSGNEKVFFDALALFGLERFSIKQSDNAIRIAHGGDFRVRHHNRDVGMTHGKRSTSLNPGRAVADHPIEFSA